MSRILVVEDEDKLRKALTKGLVEQGYDVTAVETGDEGLARANAESFDCLVLDMMLPGCDGLEIVRQLRTAGDRTPTLVLTARGSVEDRVLGLDSGADDYLGKPFAWDELLARIRACMRRNPSTETQMLHCGELTLDCVRRVLSHGEGCVELTVRQCELLEYLIRHQGQDVSRDDLARHVWREPLAGLTNVIDVYVSYLRKKLAQLDHATVIRAVRGVGYRLEA